MKTKSKMKPHRKPAKKTPKRRPAAQKRLRKGTPAAKKRKPATPPAPPLFETPGSPMRVPGPAPTAPSPPVAESAESIADPLPLDHPALNQVVSEFLTRLLGTPTQAPSRAPLVRITKFDEHYQIETRDFTNGGQLIHMTAVFHDGCPCGPPLRTGTAEETDAVHIQAIRGIREGIANKRAKAEDVLSHALGNCPCHGVAEPSA